MTLVRHLFWRPKVAKMRQHILRLIAAASPVVVLQKTQSCVLRALKSNIHQWSISTPNLLHRVSSLRLYILAWAGSGGYCHCIQWIPVLAFNLHESLDPISRSWALVIHPRFVTGPCWESVHAAIARALWQRQGHVRADGPSNPNKSLSCQEKECKHAEATKRLKQWTQVTQLGETLVLLV